MEEGPIIIKQGKPVQKYFKMFVPIDQPIRIGAKVICEHPVSKVRTAGECVDLITHEWIRMPDWICLDTYGLNTKELKKVMEDKFPETARQEHIRIIIIKQTN